MFLTDLASVLRGYTGPDGYKLKVWEEPGWGSRTYAAGGMLGCVGVLWHHTATGNNGSNYPSRYILRDGHATLPGPLCNLSLMKDGTVGVVAAGQANHAGRGSIGGAYENMGNYWLLGIEMDSDGVSNDWTAEQLQAMAHLGAALDLGYGGGGDFYQLAHREYSYDGKIDPSFINMDTLRSNINALLDGGTIKAGGGASASATTSNDILEWIVSNEDKAYDLMAKAVRGNVQFADFPGFNGQTQQLKTVLHWALSTIMTRVDPKRKIKQYGKVKGKDLGADAKAYTEEDLETGYNASNFARLDERLQRIENAILKETK